MANPRDTFDDVLAEHTLNHDGSSIHGAAMPVTAKLLRTFYQTFGQHVTEELVDWANELDTSLRSDLREITDQYYARFDAKLEQRMSEVRADIKALDAKLEQRIAESKTELIKYMF